MILKPDLPKKKIIITDDGVKMTAKTILLDDALEISKEKEYLSEVDDDFDDIDINTHLPDD